MTKLASPVEPYRASQPISKLEVLVVMMFLTT
jgi:hypothetical protein